MSLVRTIPRCWALIFITTGALLAASPARSQPAPVDPPTVANGSAGFRRVFVPSDRPEEWPTDSQRYLPVARAEFERLIRAADERRELAGAGRPQLENAAYAASLNDDRSLAGEAKFIVKLLDDLPRILRLTPWNLAMVGARWAEGAEAHDALAGAWSRSSDAAAEIGVFVERSGELEIDWLARPQASVGADLEYELQLPRALKQEFVIDLPTGLTASISPARLVRNDPSEGSAKTRWTFQLGVADKHRLRIRRPATTAQRDQESPLAATTEAYGLTRKGLDYEAEFRIQPRSSLAADLRLAVPAELHVTEVLVERSPAAWRVDEQDAGVIVVALPRSVTPANVTVRGVAAIVLDEPWRLPTIAAQRVFWTEGTATLWIDPALELQSIAPRSASLLNLVGIGGAEEGEAYRLQAWSSDANTEVIVTEREPTLHADSGVVAEFADRELAGRCQVRLWASGGPLLQVDAQLEPEWNLETVEATPVGGLAQWHVTGEGRERRLHLQLRQSPTEREPLKLAITARKPLRGWAPTASLGELAWIRFSGSDASRGRLLVKDRRGAELLAEPPARDAVVPYASLPTDERELIGEQGGGLIFDADRLEREAIIRVVSTPPRFHGEGWIELTRTDTGFYHRAEIACRPVAGAISELVVLTTRPLPADAQWKVVGTDEQLFVESPAARRRQQDLTIAPTTTEYRVRLVQPHSADFGVQVTWRGDKLMVDSINGFALPAAESWQSWATLRGNSSLVQVDPHGCLPAAAAPEKKGSVEAPGIVGVYRLGDDPSMPQALTPELKLVSSSNPRQQHGVTCWACDVTTLQFADGNQTHRIAYPLEVHDADAVDLTPPANCEIVSIRVDGVATTGPRIKASKRIPVPLPSERRQVTLTVDLHVRRAPIESSALVSPPLPETSFPVLRGRWSIATPAPFTVENEEQLYANAGWRQRLLGPLVDRPRKVPSRFLGISTAMGAPARPTHGTPVSPAVNTLAIPLGWSSATQEFASAPTPVEVRRTDPARAMWHVTWLVAAVAAAYLWPVSPRWVLALTAAMAIGCLLLPYAWIVAPQAIFIGSIAGLVTRELSFECVNALRSHRAEERQRRRSSC